MRRVPSRRATTPQGRKGALLRLRLLNARDDDTATALLAEIEAAERDGSRRP